MWKIPDKQRRNYISDFAADFSFVTFGFSIIPFLARSRRIFPKMAVPLGSKKIKTDAMPHSPTGSIRLFWGFKKCLNERSTDLCVVVDPVDQYFLDGVLPCGPPLPEKTR